jgi:membrane associated rhomboid family serine protease
VLLIALHTAAFVAQFTFEQWQKDRQIGDWLGHWLALTGSGIAEGNYWQFLSFLALHDCPLPLHLLGNMMVLYFAGREVEPIIGSRHLLGIYLCSNLLGGVAHWLAMPEVALVGVTAGVCALLGAYATILPELEITWHLFFVIPLRLRAKHLGLGLVLVTAGLWATYTAPELGPVGMLTGTLFGWIYAKQLGFGNPLAIQRYIFEKRQRAARLDRMTAEQFISAEIDPILDKVSREGMHSLSRTERKILEKGREKIAARTSAR